MGKLGWLKRWQIGSRDKAMRWLLWIGLAGMLLIALSEILPRRNAAKTDAATVSGSQVEQALEHRITTLLRQVEGVGDCQVMVTLESDSQAVYAADTLSSSGADGATSFSEQYLTVDTDTGPLGLLLTRLQPTVKGVAVVCDGGDNPVIQDRVIQVVATAFHISERRICVVKQE